MIAQLPLVVVRDVADDSSIHAIQRAAQLRVLDDHGFERSIARALAYAQQRAVHRRGTIKPGRRRVHNGLVEVVVPVPLQKLRGKTAVVAQAVDYARHAPGHRGAGVGYAIAHRVAGTYFYRDTALGHQLAYLVRKWHNKAVKIRSCDILEVTTRIYSRVQRILYDGQIAVHRLAAGLFQLLIYVVIRTAHKNAALAQAKVARELEVLPAGAYPARYLRELVAKLLAHAQRLSVALAVDEELRLPDDTLRPAEPVQHLVQLDDLLRLIGRAALLPVAEGRVRYPYLLRRVRRGQAEVEGTLGYLLIGEHIPVEVTRLSVLQAVLVLALHKDVVFAVQLYHAAAPLPESAPIITPEMNLARANFAFLPNYYAMLRSICKIRFLLLQN